MTTLERHRCKQCGDVREGRWVTMGWWCGLCEASTMRQIERELKAKFANTNKPT